MTSYSGDERPFCGTPVITHALSVFSDGKPHSAMDVAEELGVDLADAQVLVKELAWFKNGLQAAGEANGHTLYIDPNSEPTEVDGDSASPVPPYVREMIRQRHARAERENGN